MTDPWEKFVDRAGHHEIAGYFEEATPGEGGGRAHWFSGDAETVVLDRRSDPDEVGRRLDRALRAPDSAVVGYLGFDAVGLFEPALARFPSGAPFPLGELALVPRLSHGRVSVTPSSAPFRPDGRAPESDTLPRPRFERAVRALVEEVRRGEAFQVVLAHRRAWPRPDDLLARAGALRRAERYAYFYYLQFGGRVVTGASPESVSELHGRRAWVDPIAGTLPRRRPAGRRPLTADPKELAEHRMLVDLARNDLGAVADPGSVRLAWKERRLRYAQLDHLVSRVAARVRPDLTGWGLLRSTFPAGTVSGAPKIRAVELLRREEASWRGPYAGAVGLLRPARRAAWALAIRSAFAAGSRLYTAAGAGIVHRSEPRREWEETLAKLAVVENVFVSDGR